MSNEWETGICGCCEVKDCGVGCCIKLYCVRIRRASNPFTAIMRAACMQLPFQSKFQPPAYRLPCLCLPLLTVCYVLCAAMRTG